jgi:hypothetical protein
MGKTSEMPTIIETTERAEKLLVTTFVIPFILLVLMSFGMEKVWGMYLMMQVVGNMNTFDYRRSC